MPDTIALNIILMTNVMSLKKENWLNRGKVSHKLKSFSVGRIIRITLYFSVQ